MTLKLIRLRICCGAINRMAIALTGIVGLTIIYGTNYKKEIDSDPEFYAGFDNFFKLFNWISVFICFCSVILICCVTRKA